MGPGTSKGQPPMDPYAQTMAPVMPAPQIPSFVQFDQKKIPAYFNDPRRDPAPITEWIRRIENMKTSLGWTEQQTYSNAKNALFGSAASVMQTRCDVRLNADFEATWAWLKKALKEEFDECASSRAYVDLMFAMRPMKSVYEDLLGLTAEIYEDFKRIREAISDTVVPAPPGVGYDQAAAQQLVDNEKMRVVDAFAFAFIVNLLPADVRSKVLEQKPETIKETFTTIKETRRRMIDERRPISALATSTGGPRLNLAGPQEDPMESILNAVQKRFSLGRPQQGGPNGGGPNSNKKKKKGGNNSNNGNQSNAPKKCNYCHKTGHSTLDCFKRKEDKAPCYNVKGEAFYPEGEQPKINQSSDLEETHPGKPKEERGPTKGSDFHEWV